MELKRYQRNLTSQVSELEMEKFSKSAEIQTQAIIIKGLGQKVLGLESDSASLTDRLQSLSAEKNGLTDSVTLLSADKEVLTDSVRMLTEETKILLQQIEDDQPLVSSDDPVTESDLLLVKSVPISTSYVVSTSPRAMAARKKRVQPDIDLAAAEKETGEDDESPRSDNNDSSMNNSDSSADMSYKSLSCDSTTEVINEHNSHDYYDMAKQVETQNNLFVLHIIEEIIEKRTGEEDKSPNSNDNDSSMNSMSDSASDVVHRSLSFDSQKDGMEVQNSSDVDDENQLFAHYIIEEIIANVLNR